MTSIGERIKAARKAKGWSQPAVAREVGCSLATYKRYEKIEEDRPPEGFLYLTVIGQILEIDLRATPGEADDPEWVQRALSYATELQLAVALTRRIADRSESEGRATGTPRPINPAPIEVRGMAWGPQDHPDDVGQA